MVRLRQPKPRPNPLKTRKTRKTTASATYIVFLVILVFQSACQPKGNNRQFDPQKVAFAAGTPALLDGQLYPSLILSSISNSETRNSNPDSQTQNSKLKIQNSTPLAPLQVTLTAPRDNAVLRVVIDSSSLNYVTIFQEILPHRGQTYTFTPDIKWKYDALIALRQPRPLDLTLSCFINDEPVDIKNLRLNARPINECPLSLRTSDTLVDTRYLFAAYVNEDHPYIQQILTDILDQNPTLKLTGYQHGAKNVTEQVRAVWRYALERGITYASISCTSNPSPNANVQHIRFFDEIYRNRQANCIDACVFFASILRKIGLKPVIFVEPCHAYLGYYTDKERKNIALLETTITSWVNLPDLKRKLQADSSAMLPVAKYLSQRQLADWHQGRTSIDQLLQQIAYALFDKASLYNQESHQANLPHFNNPSEMGYQQLDIELLRPKVQPLQPSI